MATWPATLPKPNQPGYQLTPVDPTIRTQMEVGAPRTRRQTKARNDRVTLEWSFTDAQMAIFRAWFDNDSEAAGGASWFTIDLAIGDTGMESHEAKFDGIWKGSLQDGLNWRVSATLEVR